jgi:hypothetical protein
LNNVNNSLELQKRSIHDFEERLADIVGKPTPLRPFVCQGSPLACRAFIVGLNPASPMKSGFWDFWKPGVGFDKAAWMEAYIAERASRPLKPGKVRRNKISRSRAVIEHVLGETGSTQCLETNIYAAATEEFRELPADLRDTKVFDFLLETIRPDLIVVHGIPAVEHIKSKAPQATVLPVAHLSRYWSNEEARTLGRKIKLLTGG